MHASTAPRSRSVWADLDALVLEEVNALRTEPDLAAEEAPAFASEEDFIARAAAYLRGHGDRAALLERLSARLEPVTAEEDADEDSAEDSAEAGEDAAGAAPDQPDSAPPPPGAPEPEQ